LEIHYTNFDADIICLGLRGNIDLEKVLQLAQAYQRV
jgi:hypothetical protein